ncbi:MAG: hypothetical protein WA632_05805 [Gallionella sp.]
MSDYQLTDNVHIIPTPLGAYYATSNPHAGPARELILGMLANDRTQTVSIEQLRRYTGKSDPLQLLFRMESVRWIKGLVETETLPAMHIEADVPHLLGQLSDTGKALLTDTQGFYLVNAGFTQELAEELAVFAAEVSALQRKHGELIRSKLNVGVPAMAIIDSGGISNLGFWPLYIGEHQFVLIVSGMPVFDTQAYMYLIWALCLRYNT